MAAANSKSLTLFDVSVAVCRAFDISFNALVGKGRTEYLVAARSAFYYYAQNYTDATIIGIANYIHRDRGTLLNYTRTRESLLQSRSHLASRFYDVATYLFPDTPEPECEPQPQPQPAMSITPTPAPSISPATNRAVNPRVNITQVANACRHVHLDLAAFASEMDDVTLMVFLKETAGHLIDIAKEISTDRLRQGLSSDPIDLASLHRAFDFWSQPAPSSKAATAVA